MILKELYLYPDLTEYPQNLTGTVRDQTRCLCNYLERNILKKIRFKAEGFKRICVIGSSNPKNAANINSSNVACIEVEFSESEYLSKAGNELDEYYISLISEGLANLAKQHPIPLEELHQGLESFRKDGYKNEWVHKSKALKGTDLRASLNCKLTNQNFTLTLRMEKGGRVVYENEVLNTPPDEIVFAPKFKDLIVAEGNIQVTNKFGEVIYELPIAEVV
jgi:hypothetical protein